jgi:hypothetical protein
LLCASAGAVLAFPNLSRAAILTENFDDGNAASRWTTATANADAGADFAFDYSGVTDFNGNPIGVPEAGQTTHTGLQLWANRTGGVVSGINAYANGLNLTQSATMQFDMYAHFTDTGGSTIYGTYGFYHSTQDGTFTSLGPAATSGYWFTTSSDAGTSRAYRAIEVNTEDNDTTHYLDSDKSGSGPTYTSLFPDLDDTGANSVAGHILNRWVNVRLTRDMSTGEVKMEMKNPSDSTYTTMYDVIDATQTENSGTVTLGMTDPFASISGPNTYFLFDNLVVSAVPEPGSASLLGLLSVAALRRRRRA